MTEPPVVSSPESEAQPGWLSPAEATCPLCGYSLRGLQEPRCPECGYRFAWAEVLDPARRLHPYLFEHHPERNLWSFFQTLFGGLLPRRFWASLHPAQPSRPRRLSLYRGLTLLLTLAGIVAATASIENSRSFRWPSTSSFWVQPTALEFSFDLYRSSRELFSLWTFALAYLLCPFFTYLTMQIFVFSMRRARVHRIHAWRGVVYSYDLAVWPSLALLAASLLWLLAPSVLVRFRTEMEIAAGAACVVLPLILLRRLWCVYRHYLRFDHAFATALAVLVIVMLVMMNFIHFLVHFRGF